MLFSTPFRAQVAAVVVIVSLAIIGVFLLFHRTFIINITTLCITFVSKSAKAITNKAVGLASCVASAVYVRLHVPVTTSTHYPEKQNRKAERPS